MFVRYMHAARECAYGSTFERVYYGRRPIRITFNGCDIINVIQVHRGNAEVNVRVFDILQGMIVSFELALSDVVITDGKSYETFLLQ